MGRWARMGVVCLMGLAIGLARLVEVELDPAVPPSLSVALAGQEPVIDESPARAPTADPGGPPAATGAGATAADPGGSRTHVVKAGETLGTISSKEYGTSKHWKRILDANPGLDPARLRLGQRLILPAIPDAARR